MPRRALGVAAFAAVAAGGAALGYLAERRAVRAASLGQAEASSPAFERGSTLEVLTVEGTRLHVEAAGPEDAPTLILSHGVGLSSRIWHHQRRDLADDLRVVAYDHRGHGGSERAEDCSIEAIGHDLAAVIEHCAPRGPVLLAGHSMGGMAILSLAQHHPGLVARRVTGAVFCNTAAGVVLGGAMASAAAATLGVVQARLAGSRLGGGSLLRSQDPGMRPSSDLTLLLTRHFGMTGHASSETVALLERELRATPPIVLAAFAPGLASADLREPAAVFPLPALVIVGDRDRITPPRQGRRLAEALPRGELLELEGVGHTAMLEDPDAVTGALRRFAAATLSARVA